MDKVDIAALLALSAALMPRVGDVLPSALDAPESPTRRLAMPQLLAHVVA